MQRSESEVVYKCLLGLYSIIMLIVIGLKAYTNFLLLLLLLLSALLLWYRE